tara:strand:+ start:1326 stop:1535 length:210 start_codon:yes stop_codon:yes gene_type:complete
MIGEYPQGTTGDHWEYRQDSSGVTHEWTGKPVLMPIVFLTNCRWVCRREETPPPTPLFDVSEWLGEYIE